MDLLPTLNVWGIVLVIAGYGYGQEMNNGGDYTHTVEEEVTCYRCIYHVVKGQVSGKSSCYERFRPSIASEETCHGSCYKTYMVTNTSFIYSRGCMLSCVDHTQRNLVTRCCNRRLCNDDSSSSPLQPCLCVLFLVSALAAVLTGGLVKLHLL